MKILYTAFNGKDNSSKMLLNIIDDKNINKLCLRNSFLTSVEQVKKELETNEYDLIISFGQADLDIDKIRIEIIGRENDIEYETNCKYKFIVDAAKKKFDVEISKDADTYLCNNLYYNELKYISDNNLKTSVIFVHIPNLENITNIKELANVFTSIYKK